MKTEMKKLADPLMIATLLRRYIPECQTKPLHELIKGIHDIQWDSVHDQAQFPLHLDVFGYLDMPDIHRIVYIKICDRYRFERKQTLFKEQGVALQMYALYDKTPLYGIWIFTDPPKEEQGQICCGYQYIRNVHHRMDDVVMLHIPMNQQGSDGLWSLLSLIFEKKEENVYD